MYIYVYICICIYICIYIYKISLVCPYVLRTGDACMILAPPAVDQPVAPGLEGWSPNHWSTREVPGLKQSHFLKPNIKWFGN